MYTNTNGEYGQKATSISIFNAELKKKKLLVGLQAVKCLSALERDVMTFLANVNSG